MMSRSNNCLAKLERINRTLKHQEADRVPISDFFWDSFLKRWRSELGLPEDTDIYRYYDLDWMVTIPNVDPHIRPFEILKENDEEVIVRTGFESVIRKKLHDPMPAYLSFETDTLEKMDSFQFDDPWDERRTQYGGDNQIGGIGDRFIRNVPAWIETVRKLYSDFPIYGSVADAHEMLWRIIGPERVLLWIALYPNELARFIDRIHEFNLSIAKSQIQAAGSKLDGMVIWGDVAYTKDMLFSPEYWRDHFKSGVKSITELCHSYSIPVMYHSCGNVYRIFKDFIQLNIDAINPLEAKAGLDVVNLRREYGHRIGFCGNMDVCVWAEGTPEDLKRSVLTKLNAARGGGYIFQSDHSVPSTVSGERYDTVVKYVREYGRYPLELGDYAISDLE